METYLHALDLSTPTSQENVSSSFWQNMEKRMDERLLKIKNLNLEANKVESVATTLLSITTRQA